MFASEFFLGNKHDKYNWSFFVPLHNPVLSVPEVTSETNYHHKLMCPFHPWFCKHRYFIVCAWCLCFEFLLKCYHLPVFLPFFFFFVKERAHAWGEGQKEKREKPKQTNSKLSTEPVVGLALTTLRWWSEPKPRVRGTIQVPQFLFVMENVKYKQKERNSITNIHIVIT